MGIVRTGRRTHHPVHGSVRHELGVRAEDVGLSRRTFLTLLGAAGGLAACQPEAPGLYGTAQGQPGYLRWGNWPFYLDKADDSDAHPTLEEFEEESGIEVIYVENISDNNRFFDRVEGLLSRGQNIDYDLVVLTDWMAALWGRNAYTKPWDRAKMPNTRNLMADLEDVPYDPGRTWSMPWQSGLTGIAWNKKEIPAGIRTVDDLWLPDLKGKVDLMVEVDDTIGLILWSQGVDPSSDWGDDEFGDALDVVQRHISDGQVLGTKDNTGYRDDLVAGKAWACVAYSGDILQFNLEARQEGAEEDPYGFVVPDSGGLLWSDNFLMPHMSGRVEEVQKLIDFYYDPYVAARVAAWVNYITPVNGAQDAMVDIDPELVENEAIFPTDDTLARAAVFRPLDEPEDIRYGNAFAEVTGT